MPGHTAPGRGMEHQEDLVKLKGDELEKAENNGCISSEKPTERTYVVTDAACIPGRYPQMTTDKLAECVDKGCSMYQYVHLVKRNITARSCTCTTSPTRYQIRSAHAISAHGLMIVCNHSHSTMLDSIHLARSWWWSNAELASARAC